MFNLKKRLFLVTVWSVLFSSSFVMATWNGEDITSGFNWNSVTTVQHFYYLDYYDIVRECSCKRADVTKDWNRNHVRTTTDVNVNHTHYQDDYGEGDMASTDQVNAFWDVVFQSPDICNYNNYVTNHHNCYSWVSWNSYLQGTYNYWINSNAFSQILIADAQSVTPISNVMYIFFIIGTINKIHFSDLAPDY